MTTEIDTEERARIVQYGTESEQRNLRKAQLNEAHSQVDLLLRADAEGEIRTLTFTAALTPAAILGAGAMIRDMLDNLAINLGAQGNSIVAGASMQLSVQMAEFRETVGADLNNAITELTYEVQQTGRRLQNSIDQLNNSLRLLRECIVADLHLFLATIRTTSETLKRGVLFVKEDAPHLTNLQFDGHRPGLVPLESGRVTIRGFDLWTKDDWPPELTLWDEERKKVLATFSPEKGQHPEDEVTFFADGALLRQHAGHVVDLQVKIFRGHGIFGAKREYDLYLPIALPDDRTRAALFMRITLSYQHMYEEEGKLKRETFYGENHSNDDKAFGPDTRILSTDPTCRIVRLKQGWGGIARYVKWANAVFTERSITVNGMMEDAKDVLGVITSHSVFDYWVDPYVVYARSEQREVEAESQAVTVRGREIQLVADVDKPQSFAESDLEVVIYRVVDDDDEPVEIARIPRSTFGQSGGETSSVAVGRQRLVGFYSPGIASPRAQVVVKVTTDHCGY